MSSYRMTRGELGRRLNVLRFFDPRIVASRGRDNVMARLRFDVFLSKDGRVLVRPQVIVYDKNAIRKLDNGQYVIAFNAYDYDYLKTIADRLIRFEQALNRIARAFSPRAAVELYHAIGRIRKNGGTLRITPEGLAELEAALQADSDVMRAAIEEALRAMVRSRGSTRTARTNEDSDEYPDVP